MTGEGAGETEASVADPWRPLRNLSLVDSALMCEVVFGMVVVATMWLALWAAFGLAAFFIGILAAFGAGMWATGLTLYAQRHPRQRSCPECDGTGSVLVRFVYGDQEQDCGACFGSGNEQRGGFSDG